MIIENKCTQCNHKWKDQPGALSVHGQKCPRCGSFYYKWLSYRNDLRNYKKEFLS